MLTVKLFARSKELVGQPTVDVDWVDGSSVSELKRILGERYPQLQPLLPRLLFAINNDYANEASTIRCSDEVACFPPVSGG
jgi:molybdopterin converting factor subunit 1